LTGQYLDIHILQTVPPSNLNRDDTGSPKTAYYGGVRRARVSSQAWKRATRKAFKDLLTPDQLGIRTKHVVALAAERIFEKAPELELASADLAAAALKAAGIKVTQPRARKDAPADAPAEADQSGYLLFLSSSQVDRLADLAIDAHRAGVAVDAKDARQAADQSNSVDVSLFGRMVADAVDLNVDAAAQVAHALSVHAVENEFDYFTAVDDRAPEDNAGAGMIGTVEFNSATLYRYATINVDALWANLGDTGVTVQAVRAFIRAFATSMPTGKQNTFANRTLPDAVVVTIRDDQPVNLVGAFEDAVESSAEHTRLGTASTRLVDYAKSINAAYGDGDGKSFVVRVGAETAPLAALGDQVSLEELIAKTGDAVDAHLMAAIP
jgi:CRISPR system Cascade subunit CasC